MTDRRGAIVAVDPGKTTGVAVLWPDGEFNSWEAECWDAVRTIGDGLEEGKIAEVVVEAFDITPATIRSSRGPEKMWSLESLGALRYLASRSMACGTFKVSPRTKKRFGSDAKLKRLGWFRAGSGHANDAARHLLSHLADTRRLPGALSA